MSIEASILELAAAIRYLGSRMGEGPAPVAAPSVALNPESPKKARKPKSEPEPTPEPEPEIENISEPEPEIENISEPAELVPEQVVEDPEAAVKALLQSLGM